MLDLIGLSLRTKPTGFILQKESCTYLLKHLYLFIPKAVTPHLLTSLNSNPRSDPLHKIVHKSNIQQRRRAFLHEQVLPLTLLDLDRIHLITRKLEGEISGDEDIYVIF